MSAFFHPNAVHAGSAALFLAMALTGWQFAGDSAGSPDAATAEARPARVSTRPARTERRYGTPERAKQQLRAIRGAGSPQERMRATIALVNSLPVEELGRWLDQRWFDTREGYELTLFNKLAKERWQREDPAGYLKWTLKEGSGDYRFIDSWAQEDPARLIAFFKENPDSGRELQALARMAGHDPATAFSRFREMVSSGEAGSDYDYFSRQLLNQLAREAPSLLESELASLPGRLRIQAEAALIGERLEASFDEEVRKLWERPDGWAIFKASLNGDRSFGGRIVEELGSYPASWKAQIAGNFHGFIDGGNVGKWLEADLEGNGFTEEQALSLRSYVIQHMSHQSPEDGLRALDHAGLGEGQRRSLIANIFSNAAGNADKAAALMGLLASEGDRQAAREAIEAHNQRVSQASAKVETPAQWLEQAKSFDPNSVNSYQYLSVLRGWDEERIAELSNGFQNLPDESKRRIAGLLAQNPHGSEVSPVLRGDAIHYLVANPVEDGAQSSHEAARLTSTHAVGWAAADPVAASQWTDHLPEGDAKLWARKNLAANWAQYDPAAAAQWVDSLPAEAREEVSRFVKDGETWK